MKTLHISESLSLPIDFVTATDGIFASKGMGKSHLAQVMAEEMLSLGQVIVAIDPTDAWHGLRSSADGKSDGYPIVVIGGDHGDMKLEPDSAVMLAEAIVAERFSCVICTDGLSDSAEIKFVRVFLDTIYRRNRKPIHLFIDEADIFAPQKPFEVEDSRCIRAMSHIVRRGRKKGIGTTVITQRPAELNASVRSQVEMLFVLGMLNNLDIDAVEKWLRLRKKKKVKVDAAFDLQEEMIESLNSLQQGDAWLWAPRQGIHKRFRARDKRTFDSGATPKPGQKIREAKKLAKVDLDRLGATLAAAAQRQKDSDPAALKARVAELQKQNADLRATNEGLGVHAAEMESRARKAKERVIEKPVIAPALMKRVESSIDRFEFIAKKLEGQGGAARMYVDEMRMLIAASLGLDPYKKAADQMPAVGPGRVRSDQGLNLKAPEPSRAAAKPSPRTSATATRHTMNSVTGRSSTPDGSSPADGERRILIALAQRQGLTNDQIGIRAGLSSKSGTFSTYIKHARQQGWLRDEGNRRFITHDGVAMLGGFEPLPTGQALITHWLGQLEDGAARIFSALCAAYPEQMTSAQIGEAANLSHKSGTFSTYIKKLRGLELITGRGTVAASAELFS